MACEGEEGDMNVGQLCPGLQRRPEGGQLPGCVVCQGPQTQAEWDRRTQRAVGVEGGGEGTPAPAVHTSGCAR